MHEMKAVKTMNMSCMPKWLGKIIHWKFQGEMTAQQLIDSFASLYGDERFDDTRGQVRNLRNVKGTFTVEDVRKIAAYDRAAAKTNPNMKVAVVTRAHENHTAYAALYDAELYDTEWEVSLFTCEEDALSWVA